jgi:hypothetical protein
MDSGGEDDTLFADVTGPCAMDALLRRHGFSILTRKGNLVPVWERGGRRYSQFQALKTIPVEEIEAARRANARQPRGEE